MAVAQHAKSKVKGQGHVVIKCVTGGPAWVYGTQLVAMTA